MVILEHPSYPRPENLLLLFYAIYGTEYKGLLGYLVETAEVMTVKMKFNLNALTLPTMGLLEQPQILAGTM